MSQPAPVSLACTLIVTVLTVATAHAQFGVAWSRAPTVAVIGGEDDSRFVLVDEAVAFWNRTLQELGSGFRLGSVTRVMGPVPEEALQSLSRAILTGPRPVSVPPGLRGLPGDLTVLLGDSDFVSFAGPFDPDAKRVVGIRGARTPPLSLPNVARNVIAHELGHAIGLGHNSDPAALMCGRPAPCRPDLFRSDEPRMFPLTDGERRQLLRMYPPASQPKGP